jgi:Cof subfamily protein (haloacid dehalogenase superfamily)
VRSATKLLKLPAYEKPPGAVALDLDGTLFNSQLEISERTRWALERCLKHGLPLILATARPERSVIRFCGQALVERCSLVLSNGALARGVQPLSGEADYPLNADLARAVVDFVLEREPSTQLTVEIKGFEFGMNRHPEAAELWEVNSARPEMLLSLDEALSRRPRKISVSGLGRPISSLSATLADQFKGRIRVSPSNQDTFINIVRQDVSKSGAIEGLLRSQSIPLKTLIAFGDDQPDLDMLAACGYAVAMANATPEVKSVSPYQTLSNDEEGVAVALEEMFNSCGF